MAHKITHLDDHFANNCIKIEFFKLRAQHLVECQWISSICYGLVDKLKRMGPTKAEFQNLNFLNFHLIICSVLAK
jgi:hypothetical protein